MSKKIAAFVFLLNLVITPICAHSEVIKIGVLSQQNFRSTMQGWATTSHYLGRQLPQHVFQILPYSRQADLVTDLARNKLDFLLTGKQPLTELMTDFSLNPILNVEKNTRQWILSSSHNLPDALILSITEALLKPARKQKELVGGQWTRVSHSEIQLSFQQQLQQVYNQSVTTLSSILARYWTLLIAVLVSSLLILLYRQWDRYHTRVTEVKKHRQQSHDPGLNDTVF
ncbi:MAG: hypothetical protein PVJ63_08105 [Thioalkalispiraceae bacterium]|jgi:hypothetical protein